MWKLVVFALLTIAYAVHFQYRRSVRRRLVAAVKTLSDKKETDWRPRTRAESIFDLQHRTYDLLIIGGGSSGAGCALDAATRGLRVAMIEMGDFASKTSSKSTKLLHGGVRYLEKAIRSFSFAQLALVFEALSERYTIMANASYLAHAVQIMVPLYSKKARVYYWILLRLYDRLSLARSLGRSCYMSRQRTAQQFSGLKTEGLCGSIVYSDGMFDDARTNVVLAATAAFYGATVANYVRLDSFDRDEDGKIESAICVDALSGKWLRISAKGYISACGPLTDATRTKADQKAAPIMRRSMGTHAVYPAQYGPEGMGLLDARTADGRVMFILPWKGRILAGSTETTTAGSSAVPNESEIDFLHRELQSTLRGPLNKAEILSAWSGMRPLVNNSDVADSESLVRSYVIKAEGGNFITLAGGKWTTYRLMAEKCVDSAVTQFGLEPARCCVTRHLPLLGARDYRKDQYHALASSLGISTEYAMVLSQRYGALAFKMKSYLKRYPQFVSEEHSVIKAEVVYAIENEFACRIGDVLSNRLGISFVDVCGAHKLGPAIGDIMAEHLEWPLPYKAKQQREFEESLEAFGLGAIQQYRGGS
ncbi:glycerol-3-phosphate dehydrogenase [Pancytospora philotis]|nr:glycerol-3-phosphate dehydrogenase [Pancytospora philotis]